jgi:hypothetical protein
MKGDFVILQNTWGSDWGDNGFLKLTLEVNDDVGMCGIYKYMYQAYV